MPAPTTATELLDLVRRSGIADDARLRTHIQSLQASGSLPGDPAQLAGLLVRDGFLTYFQAEQLLQGKYKRFTIGKYKVLEKLGAGGMAQVFLCEHKLMRRRVAIKVLPTAKAEDPASLDRFYREARAVAAVDHPNLVRAYDIDQDENLHFLVMEYVDGTNLQELVKKSGPLDVTRACHYIYGASVGLEHAHEIGLVHRDIKPGNILVERAGVVKILDMGLARFFHDEDDQLTRQNDENVLGTADYLAPEQALDSHGVDIRADIYSLGATFYYLLTGSAPFPDGSVAQKLIWHQNRQPRSLKSLRPEVPDEVIAIVERMMAKKPTDRFQTPAEVMAALGGWVTTPIPPPTEREMPHLSLAAGGGGGSSGTARGPATMIGPVVAPATAPAGGFPPPPAGGSHPAATPDRGTPGPLVWESLGDETDTQSVARGDTDRTRPQPATRARRESLARSRKLLYVLVPLVVLGAAVGVYFAFFNEPKPPPPPPEPVDPHVFIVSRAPGENHVGTLREALSRATPDDRIVIRESHLAEPQLRLNPAKHRGITIEGGTSDGKLPIIGPSGQLNAMLDIGGVEGVKIRNLVFDGQDHAEYGVQLSGLSRGVLIENIVVRGVKGVPFRLSNAGGDPDRPIVFDRVRVLLSPQTTVGILLRADNADTRHFHLRNSRFEGAGAGIGIHADGPTTDLDISGNRFFNLGTAVAFGKVPKGKPVQGRLSANTVYQAKTGISFDTQAAPKEPGGEFRVAITRNYFAKTLAVSSSTGAAPAGVTSADNAFAADSAPGKGIVKAVPFPNSELPVPNPNDNDTFLRFPGGPPKTASGIPVGAP